MLDKVIWWQTDDLWFCGLDALTVYVRVAADALASVRRTPASGSRNDAASISTRRPDIQNIHAHRTEQRGHEHRITH